MAANLSVVSIHDLTETEADEATNSSAPSILLDDEVGENSQFNEASASTSDTSCTLSFTDSGIASWSGKSSGGSCRKRRSRHAADPEPLRLHREKTSDCECIIGVFSVSLSDCDPLACYVLSGGLPHVDLHFASKMSFLRFEQRTEDHVEVREVKCKFDLSPSVIEALVKGTAAGLVHLSFECVTRSNDGDGVDQQRIDLVCSTWLLGLAFVVSEHYSFPAFRLSMRCLPLLFWHFRGGRPWVQVIKDNQTAIGDFYSALKNQNHDRSKDALQRGDGFQHEDVVTQLHLHQRDAIRWMLWRENFLHEDHPSETVDLGYFVEVKTCDQRVIFYDMCNGAFCFSRPSVDIDRSGGILAEEMGLGKTVEVLSCILYHRRSSSCRQVQPKGGISDDSSLPSQNETHRAAVSFDDAELNCLCSDELMMEDRQEIRCPHCGTFQHRKCVAWTDRSTQGYLCPNCCVLNPGVMSCKTTLVLCPSTILYQWNDEINKHIRPGALKVYIYHGVRAVGYVQPKTLAEYDIVLCSYETLRHEALHVSFIDESRLRKRKRFASIPTPLTALHWWRICVDEAQMLGTATCRLAEMCQLLKASFFWCVTGTPMHNAVADLHRLFMFLRVPLLNQRNFWHKLVYQPYLWGCRGPLFDVTGRIMRRVAKVDLLDQLNIPKQEHFRYMLTFNPIEEQLYRRTHDECARKLSQVIARYKDRSVKLSTLSSRSLNTLLRPLHCLRKACCIPQNINNAACCDTEYVSMAEAYKDLVRATKRECETENREAVAAQNGMAGILWMKGEYNKAAELYVDVISKCCCSKQPSYPFRTDALQKLHALHNWRLLMQEHGDQVDQAIAPPAEVDVDAELAKLREEYMSPKSQAYRKKSDEVSELRKQVDDELAALKNEDEFWWKTICDVLRKSGQERSVLNRIDVALHFDEWAATGYRSRCNTFKSLAGMEFLNHRLYQALLLNRDTVKESWKVLAEEDMESDDFLTVAVECHKSSREGELPEEMASRNTNPCALCLLEEAVDQYGRLLCDDADQGKMSGANGLSILALDGQTADEADDMALNPINHDSALEKFLRVIHHAGCQLEKWATTGLPDGGSVTVTVPPNVLKCGERCLKLFTLMKKEFHALRCFRTAADDYLGARDELKMAAARYQTEDESAAAVAASLGAGTRERYGSALLTARDLDTMLVDLEKQRKTSRRLLEQRLSSLRYIESLRDMSVDSKVGNLEECPVCQRPLGKKWVMLSCGHFTCCMCIDKLMLTQHYSTVTGLFVRCPVCRAGTNYRRLMYVNSSYGDELLDAVRCGSDADQTETLAYTIGWNQSLDVSMTDTFSSKVTAVTRVLAHLRTLNPPNKCLVFSTWKDILRVTGIALKQSNIPFLLVETGSQLNGVLPKFKAISGFCALLMPTSIGANGLNLIEANHVVFIEPIFNARVQQQAAGRVHRVGQTRQTVVHHLILSGSIEEKISSSLKSTELQQTLLSEEVALTVRDLAEMFDLA